MQKQHSIFKTWIPEKFIMPLLVIALFPQVMILTVFSMNSTFTASFLDIDVDDIQFLFSIAYATIVCGMFIHIRFFQYFNIRNYLLFMNLLNIVVLFCLTLTTNTQLIFILRLIQGPACLFEGCILVPIIMAKLRTENSKMIAYSFLYVILLTGDKFTTALVKFAIEHYNHNMIVYTIISFHILTLIIYALVFNHGRLFPKKPMYQLGLGGIFLITIALISAVYVLVYGKRYYWFESSRINFALGMFLFFSGLFILHQRYAKRVLFHFSVLKSERVILGLIMFFCFYMLRSCMGNIYNVMNVVWHWQWEYILKIQFFNVAGVLTGVFTSYLLMRNKTDFKYIFILGFTFLSMSMLWFSYLFVPDVRVLAVVPALYLQGLGTGMLMTPLVMYIISRVDPSLSGSAAHAGVSIRFWTNTIGFSIMQNSLLYLTTKHQYYLTSNLDLSNTIFQNEWEPIFNKYTATHLYNESVHLTSAVIKSKIYNHSLLISNIEIFRTLFVFSVIVIFLIIIYRPVSQLIIKR